MTETSSFNITGKVLCLITGGSRGFGKALAFTFSQTFGDGSCIALIARNKTTLEEARTKILQNNGSLSVVTISEDLSRVSFQKATDLLTTIKGNNSFNRVILVHNVGSLGDISRKVDELNDFTVIQNYLDLNVSSVITLTSAFLKTFPELVSQPSRMLIVNITSKAAICPFPGWAQYCSGKAAREMYFKVLADEFPNTSVLNYSPGPMETDMTDEILQSALPAIQDWFKSAKAEGRLIPCEKSARKLCHLLKSGSFKSGDRVDYYDVKDD